ncbi:MAG: HAD-IC family P-type ATPase [Ignavibacteriae bacterium]|nr:HAD-IC family P-type ATPase [Ignavibacteriota bacterium]
MQFQGLTSEEVRKRKAEGLQNKSSKPRTKTIGEIFIENLFSVFNLVIFSIILFLGYFYFKTEDDRLILDSIGIFLIAFLNTFLAIFQEIKAKRALDKVNLLLKKEVVVIREGKEVSINPSEIVLDDIIMIRRGDQIVVDGEVVFSNHLEIDESLLTGESNPIHKKLNEEVLSGSFCLSGNGLYKALKIGNESYAAQITEQAKKYKFDLTPLQKKINSIVKILFVVALFLVALEVGFNSGKMDIDFVRKISTILISLVPQGLVLMATVTFAVGVSRISKLGAIVQRLNAIESFSNVQVVCMDKTGTLTQNMLSVYQLNSLNNKYSTEEIELFIGTYAKLTSDKNATIEALSIYNSDSEFILKDEFPFSSERKLSMITVEKNNIKQTFILGAYDVLIKKVKKEDSESSGKIFIDKDLGIYRNVLFGIVSNDINSNQIKENLNDIEIDPICVLSITDKIRDDVYDALKLFEGNGIKLKILSGDSAKAIQEVTNIIGWKVKDTDMITGSDLDNISEEEFKKTVMDNVIFARLKPEHKLRIIKALKKDKIYTAMIGDGVNDLPAIKEADMGIAMEEGSSITKEVADIVLLKNKFSLLPQIFDEGNKIVNTVKSVGKLFITKNFFVIYITLLSMFFFLDFPLTPRRVSLINMFGIAFPAFIITLKNTDTSKTVNFMKELLSFVVLSALIIVAAGYIGIYIAAKYYTINEKEIQMVMLTIMIITNIANYFSIVLPDAGKNILIYLLYGLGILLGYIFLAATGSDLMFIKLIKEFYEIDYIRPSLWILIMSISVVFSILLYYAQKLRFNFINKNKTENEN